jgi:hypothetical protein
MGWVHIALRTVPDITISPQLKNLREFGWGILPPTPEGVFFPARGGPTPLLESAPLRRCVLFRLQAFRPPRMPLAESHAAGSTIAGGGVASHPHANFPCYAESLHQRHCSAPKVMPRPA